MTSDEQLEPITFVPSNVDGLGSVSLVTVEPSRMTLVEDGIARRFEFANFARLQGSPPARIIGERDWFHAPPERYVRFFTDPPITVYMPLDDTREYATSVFCRIQFVWRLGGFETWDLG